MIIIGYILEKRAIYQSGHVWAQTDVCIQPKPIPEYWGWTKDFLPVHPHVRNFKKFDARNPSVTVNATMLALLFWVCVHANDS